MKRDKSSLKGKESVNSFEEKLSKKRLTVGFFVDWFDDTYQMNILKGMISKAEERDVNLLIYDAGALRSPRKYEANRNNIYEYAGKHNLDGLIILTGAIGHFISRQETEDFCTGYLPLPIISISYEIKNIPSLFINNKEGMRQLVLHFIKEHGLKKIAYIGGPAANLDAKERYDAFIETLKENGIVIDNNLIIEGEFTKASGIQAVNSLLDDRKARFEAVIAANDDMAFGAINALQERGIKIPAEVSVGGFDNNDLSTQSNPPLTTVSQSFYEQGAQSLEMVLDLIVGKKLPPRTILPAKLIVRESCGCFSQEVINVIINNKQNEKNPSIKKLLEDKSLLIKKMRQNAGIQFSGMADDDKTGALLQGFHDYLSGRIDNNAMLILWSALSSDENLPEDYLSAANKILSEFRHEVFPYFDYSPELMHKAENFFHQVRIIIGERAISEEKKRIQSFVQEFWILHDLNEELLDIFEEDKVMKILADILPQLGVQSSFISRFDESKQKARMIFVQKDGQVLSPNSFRGTFPSIDLIPASILPADRRFTIIIESLCHHDQIGVALFEMGPETGRIYGELRRVISTRLQGSTLFSQIQEQANYLKAQAQSLKELRKVMGGMIQTLSMTVEARDPYTAGHQRRVADLARAIGAEMGLSKDTIEGIRLASIVHDLGKIYVPAEILNKPGKLMPEEFNLIKVHSQVAYDILKTIDFPWPIAEIVYQHHERINGSGYPQGLSEGKIRMEARILGVADVVEAMASHRPYRPAVGVEEALKEIKKNKNVLYDPDVVDACIILFEKKGYAFK